MATETNLLSQIDEAKKFNNPIVLTEDEQNQKLLDEEKNSLITEEVKDEVYEEEFDEYKDEDFEEAS